MTKPLDALAEARIKLWRILLDRDIEQEAWFKTHSKEQSRRMMRELKAQGLAHKVEGIWKLTLEGQRRIKEAEARLKARR